MEHSEVTDKELFYEIYRFIMAELLSFPATDKVINSQKIGINKGYLIQAKDSLYYYSKERGYSIFYFFECAYWLLLNKKLTLNDEAFTEALDKMSDWLLTSDRVQEEGFELYKQLSKVTRYSKENIEEYDTVVRPELFKDKHWGNKLWLFMHRYLYRLEDKILGLNTLEDVARDKTKIKNAIHCFIWFSKVLYCLFKCVNCAQHYLYLGFDKKFTLVLEKHYPQKILEDENLTLTDLENEKAYYLDRPLTMEFYLNHKSHSKSLNKNEKYSFTSFLNDIEKCQ